MLNPYDYQIEAIEAVEEAWKAGLQRILEVLPTGSGKTLIMGKIIEQSHSVTLVLEQGIELVHQTAEVLKWLCPNEMVGILRGKRNFPSGATIVVASVQTLSRPESLDEWKHYGFELIICDEAHHIVAPSYRRILSEFGCFQPKGCRVLGLTATGKRGDHVALGHVFEDIVYERTLEEMILAGYLADLRPIIVKTDVQLLDLRTGKTGDFNPDDLEPLINTVNRNRLIVETYLEYGENRKTLCFATSVNHAINLAKDFRRAGIRAAHIHGRMSQRARKRVLEEFKNGAIQVVVNFNLLIEGYDQPDIGCLIMGRPTRSWTLYMQMLGRGVRKCEEKGKTDCIVIDVADIYEHHKIQDLATLLGEELKDSPASAILKEAVEKEQQREIVKPMNWNRITKSKGHEQSEQEIIAQMIGNKLWAKFLDMIRNGNYDFTLGENHTITVALSDDEHVSLKPEKNGFQIEAINHQNHYDLTSGIVSPPWAIEVLKAYLDTRINTGDEDSEPRIVK